MVVVPPDCEMAGAEPPTESPFTANSLTGHPAGLAPVNATLTVMAVTFSDVSVTFLSVIGRVDAGAPGFSTGLALGPVTERHVVQTVLPASRLPPLVARRTMPPVRTRTRPRTAGATKASRPQRLMRRVITDALLAGARTVTGWARQAA